MVTPQLTRFELILVKTKMLMKPLNGNVVPKQSWNLYHFPRFRIHLKVCKDKGELDWIGRDKSITTHGNMELTCSSDH